MRPQVGDFVRLKSDPLWSNPDHAGEWLFFKEGYVHGTASLRRPNQSLTVRIDQLVKIHVLDRIIGRW